MLIENSQRHAKSRQPFHMLIRIVQNQNPQSLAVTNKWYFLGIIRGRPLDRAKNLINPKDGSESLGLLYILFAAHDLSRHRDIGPSPIAYHLLSPAHLKEKPTRTGCLPS